MDKRIIIGASGASGLPILVKILEIIKKEDGISSALIMTESAKLTLEYETGKKAEDIISLADEVFSVNDIGAGPASGSFHTDGMIIVPCSMKTLAGVHSGYAENLLLRAADVTIKEKRPLVLAVRESPLSPIHLRNMQELSILSNVHIIPPMLSFYQKPESIDDMVYQVAARLLVPFGIEAERRVKWNGM